MRVLFTSIREAGHFLPLVPFIQACRRHGHEVAVSAPPEFADRVTDTGALFFPFGHPGDAGLAPIWARMREASQEEMKNIAVCDLFAGALAGAAMPALIETIERWHPTVVIREAQEYGAVVASEKCGVPHARVAISLTEQELEFSRATLPRMDEHRARFGVAPDPAGEWLLREPVLTLLPPTFDAEGPLGAAVKRFRDRRDDPKPLPDWWRANRDPFVYLTLGTVTGGMDAQRGAYRIVLDAVAGLPVRVLLTVGSKTPLETLGDVPPNVHVERFVPQEEVLPHASAIVCHGGTGTVTGALSAGVPLVVLPLFADQPINAERIQTIGAGIGFAPRAASSGDVRRALVRVLEEPAFREVARRIAGEIAALPVVDEAAREIERLGKG
jgi:UDP:flavonoid glycosyltransferase YjiC (YdhE family)